MVDRKQKIAMRAAKELSDGDVVNLGIGIPTLVADYVPAGIDVFMHTENGLLGVGPTPSPEEIDPDLVNAGKHPVTETIGSSFFSSADSFAMIRGHHIDVAILGTLQVDAHGRIANWSVPGKAILGVGGAMDLLVGAKKVIVTLTHTSNNGESKIVERCTLPITAERKVDMIITELAVFTVGSEGLVLVELMPDVDIEEVKQKTGASFQISLTASVHQ